MSNVNLMNYFVYESELREFLSLFGAELEEIYPVKMTTGSVPDRLRWRMIDPVTLDYRIRLRGNQYRFQTIAQGYTSEEIFDNIVEDMRDPLRISNVADVDNPIPCVNRKFHEIDRNYPIFNLREIEIDELSIGEQTLIATFKFAGEFLDASTFRIDHVAVVRGIKNYTILLRNRIVELSRLNANSIIAAVGLNAALRISESPGTYPINANSFSDSSQEGVYGRNFSVRASDRRIHRELVRQEIEENFRNRRISVDTNPAFLQEYQHRPDPRPTENDINYAEERARLYFGGQQPEITSLRFEFVNPSEKIWPGIEKWERDCIFFSGEKLMPCAVNTNGCQQCKQYEKKCTTPTTDTLLG